MRGKQINVPQIQRVRRVEMAVKTGTIIAVYLAFHLAISQKISVGYIGTNTTIECPLQGDYTFPSWQGPPISNGIATEYYDRGSGQFNPVLQNRYSMAANSRSLILTGTRRADEGGVYTCSARIGSSFMVATNTMNVRERPSAPEITTSVPVDGNGTRATEGQPLTVTCNSRGGYPAPNVALYLGSITGQKLAEESTGTPIGDSYTVILSHAFVPTRENDRQQLVCRSYYPTPADAQDSQQTQAKLFLYLKPLNPNVTQLVDVAAGGEVAVECRTTGSRPAPTIVWGYLGQTYTPVVSTTLDDSTQTFTTVSVLRKTVMPADNGQTVQCRVTHKALTAVLTDTEALDVKFRPLGITIQKPGSIIADGRNTMSILCVTDSSNPVAVVTWSTANIKTLSPNNTESPGRYGGTVVTSEITFTPTRDHDGAPVSCTATNAMFLNQQVSNSTTIDNINYSPLISMVSDQTVTEGDRLVLKCSASSKPAASFRWSKGTDTVASGSGTASYNGLDYTIANVSRTQNGIYTCFADNQISPTDARQTILAVQYPPDVAVIAVNATIRSQLTTVTCDAKGVPSRYTYEGWLHTWNGHIVAHQEALPASRLLNLTSLSYAHSGVYRCGASNGVKQVSYGEGSLLVKSFPILIGNITNSKEIKAFGRLMKPTVITFQYYSNAGSGSVKVLKANESGEEVVEVHQRIMDIKLPVFLSEIPTRGTEVTINITVTEESQFGEYQIIVTNEIDNVKLSLKLLPLSPPETPLYVNNAVLGHHSVIITWVSGFPNGLNQTFIIQMSIDNSAWRNITQYGGMSFQVPHTQIVDNLVSSQLYFWRMLAVNDAGESQPTSIRSFETKDDKWTSSAAPEDTEYSSGAMIGTAVGGFLAGALAVVFVGGAVVWRRGGLLLKRKRNAAESAGKREESLVLEDKQNKRDERAAAITSASNDAQPSYETLGATGDAQCYEQLQGTRTGDPRHAYDNTGMSSYEALQTSRKDNTNTYDQLHRSEHQTKVYENLEVSSI